MIRWLTIFVMVAMTAAFQSTAQVPGVLPVKEWKGELFRPREGALYIRAKLQGFRNERAITGSIMVTMYNIIQQKNVIVAHSLAPIDTFPREMWRVPSGKYRIDHIELIDGMGVKRSWHRSPQFLTTIIVPRSSLANLGIWNLSPEGTSGLTVKFGSGKNTYTEESPKNESSIAVVVNGFTGVIQEVFAGKKVLDGAETNHSDGTTLRATSSVTRQIGMFYKLDLFKDNSASKSVLRALNGFDNNLRGCYSRALNGNLNLRGTIVFKILISDRTGTMRQVRRSAGTLNDDGLTDCLVGELGQIPLPVRRNMIGELAFTFDFAQR